MKLLAHIKKDTDIERKKQKFILSCGCDKLPYTESHYRMLYLRQTILDLQKFNKPLIITGLLNLNPYDCYYSFNDIKPYYPKYENSLRQICGHININKDLIDPYINFCDGNDYTNKRFVLICRPYQYKDTEQEIRGGLTLTAELKVKPICLYDEAEQYINSINTNLYIDFFNYHNGYFLGISASEIEERRKQEKAHKKYLAKQMKKKENNNLPFLNKTTLISDTVSTSFEATKKKSTKRVFKKPITLNYLFIEV